MRHDKHCRKRNDIPDGATCRSRPDEARSRNGQWYDCAAAQFQEGSVAKAPDSFATLYHVTIEPMLLPLARDARGSRVLPRLAT